MEYIIGLVLALLGGLLFYKNKSDKASTDAKLGETRGRDKELAINQKDIQNAIDGLDAGIEKMKAEREAQRLADENLSLKERADKMKKQFSQ